MLSLKSKIARKYYINKFKYSYLAQSRDVIFCLHGFNHRLFSDNYGQVSKKFLDNMLSSLKKKYLLVDLDDLLKNNTNQGGAKSFPKAAVTIDDGLKSTLGVLDVFKKNNIRPTIFICPELINSEKVMFPELVKIAFLESKRNEFQFPNSEKFIKTKSIQQKIQLINKWVEYFKFISFDKLECELNNLLDSLGITNEMIKKSVFWDPLLDFGELEANLKYLDIGSHTNNHFYLSSLPSEISFKEISDSKNIIESELSVECKTLAYPFGDNNAFGEREKRFSKECNYTAGFSLIPGAFNQSEDRFNVHRYNIGNGLKALF